MPSSPYAVAYEAASLFANASADCILLSIFIFKLIFDF